MATILYKQNKKKIELLNKEWYSLRSILGYSWAMWYFLLGGREAGKSYAVTNFFVGQWKKYGRPFYWLRLTEASKRKLLMNNAEKLVDADLRKHYKLDLTTNGDNVYEVIKRDSKGKIVEKKLMARVLDLSTFYNDKGSGLFDKDFLSDPKMYYNICLDEMNREKNERNSFDIVYAFVNQLENLIRSSKVKTRIICVGNTLDDASDILSAFNFIPEEFGRFKLVKNKKQLHTFIEEYKAARTDKERAAINKKYFDVDFGKRAVIEYIEPSEKYRTRRKGTIADILMPTASTFTNEIEADKTLISKERLVKPNFIIKFTDDMNDWFTVWNSNLIRKYNGEKCTVIAMRPLIRFEKYIPDNAKNIVELFDTRCFTYHNLVTFKQFQKQINILKPRKNG